MALHRAPPELWPWLGGEEVRGPTSWAVPIDGMGTVSVEAVKAPPVPGVQKPPHQVENGSRTVAEEEEGEETSGSENEIRLVAAGPPGSEPGGLPWRHGLPGMASTAVQALKQLTATTSSRDPTRMVKERGLRRRTA